MESQNTDAFWKWWKSVYCNNKSQVPPVVEGHSSKEGIAGAFQRSFEKNCKPNNPDRVQELNSRFKEKYEEFSISHVSNCDCADYKFSLDTIIDAIFSMKQGKSPDDDGIHAEHFQNGPLILLIRLTTLFNNMLTHSYVPTQFRFGTIIPIIKDRNGNSSDTNNYRGITISAMPSKVFEHALKIIFSRHLRTSSYQYGFKPKSSTSHALFSLRETINHYIDHGNRVFCSFLDAFYTRSTFISVCYVYQALLYYSTVEDGTKLSHNWSFFG